MRQRAPAFARLAVAGIVAALLASSAGAFSYAVIVSRTQPELSQTLFPGITVAAGKRGDIELARAGNSLDRARAARVGAFARDTLLSSPLSPQALRQLAVIEAEQRKRKQLFDLALEVSRRDVIAVLQRSEFDLRNNDDDSALHGYDRALRTSRRAGPLVFPVLLGATDDPSMRRKIREILASNPIWAERLVAWSIENPNSLGHLSRVVTALPKGATARSIGYGQAIIGQLASQGRAAEAFAAYPAFAPRPEISDLSRTQLPPIDWALSDEYESGARPADTREAAFELFAEPNKTGIAAQRLVGLAPGAHRLRLRFGPVEGKGGEIRIALSCLDQGKERELMTTERPFTTGTAVIAFMVPARCRHQSVRLSIAAGEQPVSGILSALELGAGGGSRPRSPADS